MKRLISILLAAVLIFCYTIPTYALSTEELIEDTLLIVEDNPTISNRIYNAIVDFIQEILSIIRQIIQPNCEHSGGTANCCEKAICEKCGLEYGDFNPNNHSLIGSVNVSIPPYRCSGGYTGDLVCDGCGEMVFQGSEIPAFVEHCYYSVLVDFVTLTYHNRCEECGHCYDQSILNPLEIEYVKTDNHLMYFYINNCLPTNDIVISETWETQTGAHITSSPAFRKIPDNKSFQAELPQHGDIITITITEYGVGEDVDGLVRETSKQFNTKTKTWIEE